MTECNDSEDGHNFDSIVSRGFGNISLENNQTNEGEGNLRDDVSVTLVQKVCCKTLQREYYRPARQ